jgi:hypothetical protein
VYLPWSFTLAATDLKLKSEYDKKNLVDYMVFTALPVFHYVKDNFTDPATMSGIDVP